ncbi:MAG: Na+/galactose cotransporter, partial [Brachybacterium sp.]|nr:Na+/galactose cotransporter [Brachybacterium sp.]
TVVSYDLYQQYVKKDAPDDHYTMVGRVATAAACVIAIFTALIAGQFSNLMDYLQTLFGFFNAPLFATFILGMFWKRMTATAGWTGLVSGTLAAVALWASSTFFGVFELPGQGLAFVSAATAFVVDIVVSVVVTQFTAPKPAHALKGLVYSETPRADLVDLEEKDLPLWRRPVPMAGLGLILVIILNIVFA